MFPLLPFTAGVIAGAFVLRLAKHDKARSGFEKAQNSLRGATVTGLEAIESTSAKVRQRLIAPDKNTTKAAARSSSTAVKKTTATKPKARKSTAKLTSATTTAKDGVSAV